MGQPELAAEKFKRAMEIARNAGRAEEERIAARELEAVKQHLIESVKASNLGDR